VTNNIVKRVFEPLSRYARLPTNYIVALYGGEWVKQTLKTLYHETETLPVASQLLNRPEEINRNVGSFAWHELGPAAFAYLNTSEEWVAKTKIGGHRRSAHDLHINLVTASFEIAVRRIPYLRWVGHLEILDYIKCSQTARDAKRPLAMPTIKGSVEHDAIFGWCDTRTNKYSFYALELDRGTESLTVWKEKIQNIDHVFDRKTYTWHLGLPNYRPLILTQSATRETNVRALITKHQDAYLFHQIDRFNLFQNPPPPMVHLLTDEWRTKHGTANLI
jgi:hypothetical protein